MGNITQNKPATASISFAPFLPARAVDGVSSPANRWVSPQVPAWLAVDLQNNFRVNQWTANLMGNVGWAPGYNIKNYKNCIIELFIAILSGIKRVLSDLTGLLLKLICFFLSK